MNTIIVKIPIDANLDTNIRTECDIRLIAGHELKATFTLDAFVVLIFQPK